MDYTVCYAAFPDDTVASEAWLHRQIRNQASEITTMRRGTTSHESTTRSTNFQGGNGSGRSSLTYRHMQPSTQLGGFTVLRDGCYGAWLHGGSRHFTVDLSTRPTAMTSTSSISCVGMRWTQITALPPGTMDTSIAGRSLAVDGPPVNWLLSLGRWTWTAITCWPSCSGRTGVHWQASGSIFR